MRAHLIVPVLALLIAGCPKKTTATDAAGLDGAVAAGVNAGAETTNDAQIARYPDEQAIDHAAATVKVAKATVLKSVPKGDVVATLKKGDAVAEVSEHNGYYRVVFADPNDATKKLSGWIVKFAFDDTAIGGKRAVPKCTGDGTILASDKANPIIPRCTIMCTDDVDCPSGKCESALILNEKGDPAVVNGDTHFMSVCSAKTKFAASAPDAGAPKDGGAKPAAAAALKVPHCANDEGLWSINEHGPIFCAKGDNCSTDKDCAGKGTCLDAMIMQDDGTPALSHNGSPMGTKICKPK